MLQMPTMDEVSGRVHSIAEGRMPDLSTLQWPRLDVPSVDVGRTLGDAATAVGLRRRPRRSRRPLAILAIVGAAVIGWLIFSQRAVREQARAAVDGVRDWAGPLGPSDGRHHEAGEPIAFSAPETAPFDAEVDLERSTRAGAYPVGMGANNGVS